ncbi:uncharacterized protein LOC111385538 [Olea europaea var. sylvestris]|uniref:uncharacterized protein LOC111385538 n=1 Tax=Olea europaea var. sylvestris TaxID=158386 RepID=UPI000C1CD242|nr:uncharacterized protein LOC111385538 [Olea europaea var. sylvestris]
MLKGATENSEFNFHPKCGPLKITHLAFADDLMLLARGDAISVGILMECLSNFGDMSGLKMNVNKLNLYTAGVHRQELEDIVQLTNLVKGSMPFLYLRIPLAAIKLKISSYDSLINKTKDYIGA